MTTEAVQIYTASHERVAIAADTETSQFTAVRDGHPLSPCAAAFCDGDLSRYLELYNVVFHSQSAKPNNVILDIPLHGLCSHSSLPGAAL